RRSKEFHVPFLFYAREFPSSWRWWLCYGAGEDERKGGGACCCGFSDSGHVQYCGDDKKEQGTTMLSAKKKLKMMKKRPREKLNWSLRFKIILEIAEYLPPEFFMHGIVDEKTDVYAYGVLLLELITGRQALDSSQKSLIMWAMINDIFAHRKPARVFGSVFYCMLLASSNLFFAGYATLAIGTEWIFRPKQEVISPVLCNCDVLLLLLIGFFLALLLFHSRNEVFLSFFPRNPFSHLANTLFCSHSPDIVTASFSIVHISSLIAAVRGCAIATPVRNPATISVPVAAVVGIPVPATIRVYVCIATDVRVPLLLMFAFLVAAVLP
ncbi:hypothetical protein HN51_066513, partial [Arachis hypogaea]